MYLCCACNTCMHFNLDIYFVVVVFVFCFAYMVQSFPCETLNHCILKNITIAFRVCL